MSRRLLVLILLPVFLGLSRGIAEASRYDFNGVSEDEIIVWDGSFEVSTESNNCSQSNLCNTLTPSVFQLGFAISGPAAGDTTFDTLTMVLMSTLNTLDCGGNPNCGPFLQFFPEDLNDNEPNTYLYGTRHMDQGNVRHDPFPNQPNVLPTVLLIPLNLVPVGGVFLAPTGPDALRDAFLADPNLRIGLISHFSQTQRGSFALDLVTPTQVPEPATLTLLGTGIAAAIARRRRVRR